MKTFRTIILLVLCIGFVLSITSCFVTAPKDNGHHKGWYNHPGNPPHPNGAVPAKPHDNHKK